MRGNAAGTTPSECSARSPRPGSRSSRPTPRRSSPCVSSPTTSRPTWVNHAGTRPSARTTRPCPRPSPTSRWSSASPRSLPNYSGGLGILAGDHLKSASDLGVPIIGVGLLYRFGYFWQSLSLDGWQQEHYPAHDPQGLPHRPGARRRRRAALGQRADAGRPAADRADLAGPGRPGAAAAAGRRHRGQRRLSCAATTDRLYGGDQDHRIKQEILLGIGGVRAVRAFAAATGHPLPEVFHMNEGHAGFLGLERINSLIAEHGLTFAEALSAVRAGTVFTTHTPVPAGIDRFPVDLVRHYLDPDGNGDVPAAARPGGRRGARARRRGRPEPVQHGAHGSAAGPAGERGGQAARRRCRGTCSRRCTRASSPTRCRSAR